MKLASLFCDHAVLQRDKPIPVWGWAQPGGTVEVVFGRTTVQTVADERGEWRVMLPPRHAGGPFELRVRCGDQEQVVRDIYVGEVWLCSGQSNMEMVVASCLDAEHEIAKARFPRIRMFLTARVATLQPRRDVEGVWKVCSPETVGHFSAAAYFFGREIHRRLGVPVGLIHSSWGGTPAEAWTSREGLLSEPALRHYVVDLDRFLGPEGEIKRREIEQAVEAWKKAIPKDPGNEGEALGWHRPEWPDADWGTMDLPTGWQAAGYDFSGVFWFQRTLEIPPAWAGRDLELHIGACDKRDYTYFNGEFLGTYGMEDDPEAWRTPRVYRIPGARVQAGRAVIAVRVFSEIYQGGMIGPANEMWCGPAGAPVTERIPLDGPWRLRIERNFGKTPTAPPVANYGEGVPHTPTSLYNGMIAPHPPYALRGFLWYQGESNASRAEEYRILFPALIRDWRNRFGQGDLPFYFVQLANFQARPKDPVESQWAELREAQRLTLERVPRTGMAVALDIGEANDIHPKNKQDVGRRLAACALAFDYGRPQAIGSSPLPVSAWRNGGVVVVRLAPVGRGLRTREGEAVVGFALAGADRVFVWAEARLEGHDRVVLKAPGVAEPRWIRYGWADNPEVNLYGSTGLPASSFEIPIPYGRWLLDNETGECRRRNA